MNSAFNNQILAEKLAKLNNSQQSIETLSHWCIFHRKKARQVVETWDKQFRELPKEQQVPFLFLANDILQNSRRKGGEFVSEFWRILPGALKDVLEKGDNDGQNAVLRLVNIWDERKVFGSREKTLREELLGNELPPDLPDHHVELSPTIIIKVPAGGIQEKMTSAYQSLHYAATDDDTALSRCNAAVICIDNLEKEANSFQNTGELQDITTLADKLQEQQNILSTCIEQLAMSATARSALVSHLKEALQEQESKVELIRAQLQTAQSQAEHCGNLSQHFLGRNSSGMGEITQHRPKENGSDILEDSVTNQQQSLLMGENLPWPPVPSVESMTSAIHKSKMPKSATTIAAEVVAKLAASNSSAEVLKSVLSSLAAEESSSMRISNALLEFPSRTFVLDKWQRLNAQISHIQSEESCPAYGQYHLPTSPLQSTMLQHQPGSLQIRASPSQQPPLSSQQLLPPLPPLQPQPQYIANSANGSIQSFGFAPGCPPRPPLPLQGQPEVGVPRMVMYPQNTNPGTPQTLQPPRMGFCNQPPLPAYHGP